MHSKGILRNIKHLDNIETEVVGSIVKLMDVYEAKCISTCSERITAEMVNFNGIIKRNFEEANQIIEFYNILLR